MDFREDTIETTYGQILENRSVVNEFETMEESAERLIKECGGGDINSQDEFGNTFLHHAVKYQYYDLCQFLLRKGACSNIQNMEGNTAMIYSVLYGNYKIVCLLLENDGDPRIPDNFGANCFHLSNNKKITKALNVFYPQY